MGDTNFKKNIIKGEHKFSNGSAIECKLQITTIYDEFGDEKSINYSVKAVYGFRELPQEPIKLTAKGTKKREGDRYRQESLFDNSDIDNI